MMKRDAENGKPRYAELLGGKKAGENWEETFNIQHSTFNIQHSTFNIQRPTPPRLRTLSLEFGR
jgi:hypothetical protein